MNFDCYAVIDTDYENQHTGFDLYEDRNDAQDAFNQIIDDIQDAFNQIIDDIQDACQQLRTKVWSL